MIFDRIENLQQYAGILPGVEKIKSFLDLNIIDFRGGTIHLDGVELYVNPFNGTGRLIKDATLEAHRHYIDIQVLLKGEEEIGWRPLLECHKENASYDEKNDIIFFEDQARDYIKLTPGYFAVFFPEDAHAPLIGSAIQKLIFKLHIAS